MLVSVLKTENQFRYGMTFSKKIGNAVLRNKLKRWTRDFFKCHFLLFKDVSFEANIIIRTHQNKDYYKKIDRKQFDEALFKFSQLLSKNN